MGVCNSIKLHIVGLVRDNASTLLREIENFKQITDGFKSVSYFLVESDSNDNTLEILSKLSNNFENFNFISLGNIEKKFPKRTERLAHCRNQFFDKYFSYISNIDNEHYVIVADFDGLNFRLSKKSLINCWENKQQWDGLFANQNPYYDIWALRAKGWCEGDCWQEYNKLKTEMSDSEALAAAVTSKQIYLDQNSGLVSVDSAFGGLGIYKALFFLKGRYEGVKDGNEVCEHVHFNKMLISQGAKLYINPKLINISPKDHIMTPFKRIKLQIKTLLKDII